MRGLATLVALTTLGTWAILWAHTWPLRWQDGSYTGLIRWVREELVKVHWKHREGHAWCGAPVERCGARGAKGGPGRTGEGNARSTNLRRQVTCQTCLDNHDRAKPEKYGEG